MEGNFKVFQKHKLLSFHRESSKAHLRVRHPNLTELMLFSIDLRSTPTYHSDILNDLGLWQKTNLKCLK